MEELQYVYCKNSTYFLKKKTKQRENCQNFAASLNFGSFFAGEKKLERKYVIVKNWMFFEQQAGFLHYGRTVFLLQTLKKLIPAA